MTITLPIVVVAIFLFAIIFSFQFIVNKRCKALKGAVIQNCKELFDTIKELRDLSGKMKEEDKVPKIYITQLDGLAERGRKITASVKNTIQDAL